MHTTTITVRLEFRDNNEVACNVDAKSTDPTIAQELKDSRPYASMCFTAFSSAISTLCHTLQIDTDEVLEIMKVTSKRGVNEALRTEIRQKPTN